MIDRSDDTALVAIQGPRAMAILERATTFPLASIRALPQPPPARVAGVFRRSSRAPGYYR